jgi:Tfp pilus assembly PilM family ATPase
VTNLAIAVGSACYFTRPLSAVWDDDDAGSKLADEIRLSIDYYMTQPQAKPVVEVVLSGPGSSEKVLAEGLEMHLGIPVRTAAPLGAIDGSALGPTEDPNRYTVAAGLSLGAAA